MHWLLACLKCPCPIVTSSCAFPQTIPSEKCGPLCLYVALNFHEPFGEWSGLWHTIFCVLRNLSVLPHPTGGTLPNPHSVDCAYSSKHLNFRWLLLVKCSTPIDLQDMTAWSHFTSKRSIKRFSTRDSSLTMMQTKRDEVRLFLQQVTTHFRTISTLQ